VANNTTIGFTLKVNGVDQAVTSIDALDQSIQELESTLKSASFGSEEFKKVEQQLIKARSAKEDLDKSLEGRGAEKRLQGIVGVAESLGGAFAIASQASALFGKENEDIAKAEAKAQQALAVVMGIRAIKEGLLNSTLERKLILEKAAAAGTVILNTVNKAFNLTLTANPIGLIVTALGLLVVGIMAAIGPIKKFIANFDFLGEAVEKTLDTLRNVASFLTGGLIDDASTAKTRDNSQKMIDSLDDIGSAGNKMIAADKRRLAYMQAAGATEEELLAQKKKINKEEVASRQQAINALLKLQAIDGELDDDKKKKLAELQESIKDLNNQANIDQAEFNKKQSEDRKKANEDAKAKQVERNKAYSDFVKEYQGKIAEANKKTKELENQATLNAIDDEDEKAKKTLEIQQKAQKDELQLAIDTINKKKNLSKEELAYRAALLKQMGQLDIIQAQETDKLTEDQAKKRKDHEEAFAKELEAIKDTTFLNGISNQRIRAEEEARIQEENAIVDIQNSERTETEKQQLIDAIKAQFAQNDKLRKETNKQEDMAADMAFNDWQLGEESTTYAEKIALLDANEEIINNMTFANENERTMAIAANAKARVDIDKAAAAAKEANLNAISGMLANASALLGQNTVAGKATAIAQTTIDTYLAAQKAYASLVGIPFVGPALAAVAAGIAVAGGLMNVKKIVSEQVPSAGGGGGGAGGRGAAAAPQPSKFAQGGMVTGPGTGTSDSIPALLSNGEAVINSSSVAQFGSILSNINQAGGGAPIPTQAGDRGMAPQIIKTYVVASDMSSQQEADKRLTDIARI
jgi:hypothetical protein